MWELLVARAATDNPFKKGRIICQECQRKEKTMRDVIARITKYESGAVAFDFISDTGTVGHDDL
jgi:hypothetical protein